MSSTWQPGTVRIAFDVAIICIAVLLLGSPWLLARFGTNAQSLLVLLSVLYIFGTHPHLSVSRRLDHSEMGPLSVQSTRFDWVAWHFNLYVSTPSSKSCHRSRSWLDSAAGPDDLIKSVICIGRIARLFLLLLYVVHRCGGVVERETKPTLSRSAGRCSNIDCS